MVTEKYDEEGNPFGVFCINPACPFFDKEGAHPIWSEDCPEKDGRLACPACASPVRKPQQ